MNILKFYNLQLVEQSKILGVAAFYYFITQGCWMVFPIELAGKAVCAATGFSLAVTLLGGKRYVIGVFLGALLVQFLLFKSSFSVSLVVAFISALEALVGFLLLTRIFKFNVMFESLRDYLYLIAMVGGGIYFMGALMSAMVLSAANQLSGDFSSYLLTIWRYHAQGIILVTPFVLVWRNAPSESWSSQKIAEFVLIIGFAWLLGQIVFLDWLYEPIGRFARGYWLFLMITVAAVRLGLRGTLVILLMTTIQALLGTKANTGLFASDIGGAQLTNLWMFTVSLSFVGIALAIYLKERQCVEQLLQVRMQEQAMHHATLLEINQGTDLPVILNTLALQIETLHPDLRCSIFLLDQEGKHIQLKISPSLPDFGDCSEQCHSLCCFGRASGAAVECDVSCMAADMPEYSNWDRYKNWAVQTGIYSCWSVPIKNNQGKGLGVIAIYYLKPGAPSDSEYKLVENYASLAQLAIERRQIEADSDANKVVYRELFENMSSAVAVYKTSDEAESFVFCDVNRAGEALENKPRAELMGRSVTDVFPAIKQMGLFDVLQRVYKTGYAEYFPIAFDTDNHSEGWRENFVYRLPTGEVVTIYQDVTSHKQIEAALYKNEALFRSIFEQAAIGIAIISLDLQFINANQTYSQTLGYSQHELLALNLRNLCSGENQWQQEELMRKLISGEITKFSIESQYIQKDGQWIWVNVWSTLITKADGSPDYFLGILININDRKLSEHAVQESEERLNFVLEGSELSFWDWNIVTGEVKHNHILAAMLGCDKTDIKNTTQQWLEVIYPQDCRKVLQSIHNVLSGKASAHELEYRMLHKNGDIVWLQDHAKIVQRDADGRPLRMAGTHANITGRKQMEEKLRSNVNFFESITQINPVGIYQANTSGAYTFITQRWSEITGLGFSEANGSGWINALHEDDRDRVCAAWFASVNGQQPFNLEYRFKHADGKVVWVNGQSTSVYDSAGNVSGFIGTVTDISAQKQVEILLRDSEERFRGIFNQAPLGIGLFDSLSWKIYLANSKFTEILGRSVEELNTLDCREICHPDDIQNYLNNMARMNAGETDGFQMDKRFIHPDGRIAWINMTVARMEVEDKAHPRHHCIIEDITERKNAETELRIAATAFESQEGILVTDADCNIIKVNHAFCAMTGYSVEEILGKNPRILKSGQHNQRFYRTMWQSIHRYGSWQGEIMNLRKSGGIFPEWLTITAVKGGSSGDITHYVATLTDISLRKQAENEIRELAFYDPLTKLPNRRLMTERMQHGIDRAIREQNQLAVLMLDLDRFKAVNDTLGHLAGDNLLIQVAARIKHKLRDMDMVARYAGDEFVVMMENVSRGEDVARVAEEIIVELSKPFDLDQSERVWIGTSIGIALFPEHGDTPQTLLGNADIALYQSKARGKGCFSYFSEKLTIATRARIALETRLRLAIAQQELCVYYQPQVDMGTGRIIGAEALVRWQHPIDGLMFPNEFIDIANDTSLVIAIDQWVLKQTCEQGRQWLDAGLPALNLAVNISPYSFKRGNIVALIASALEDSNYHPEKLVLEVTEVGLMGNQNNAGELLKDLKDLGVRLAIDDFGTGFSSLACLKLFPVDVLKIDNSFIHDISTMEAGREITATIIAMARNLGFNVLAEGVDTQEQFDFLQSKGCDSYQGHFYSTALPANEFAELMQKQLQN